MTKPIRVLIIEDSPNDTAVLVDELKKVYHDLFWHCVDRQESLIAALDNGHWDLILSDYEIPGFGGLIALSLVREKGLDVPFILVSGMMSESTAVLAMKMGATDCIMKVNLQRLLPAIERELRDAAIRHKHRLAEDAFRDQEGVLRAITSSVKDAIIMIDNDGNISFWNEAASRILGYKKDEVLGKSLHHLISPARFNNGFAAAFPAFQSNGQGPAINKTLELEAIRKNRTVIPVELSLSSVRIKGKWCAIGILRDITERQKVKEELIMAKEKAEESSRLKSSLLLNINHELRTPMNGILGFARILKEAHTKIEYIEMADTILTSGKRLMATLNSILDLAHLESDQTRIYPEIVNLTEEVHNAVKNYEDLAKKKNIELSVLSETELYANVDRGLFRNIIHHLVDNAIKFTKSGSVTILVEAELRGKSELVAIRVKDTGTGILPEQKNYIFEAFRQGSEGLARTYEGTGLGLTLCKKFVDLLNGEIDLETIPGTGTVFIVRFPRVYATKPEFRKPDREPGQTEPIPVVEKVYDSKPLVLIVEDNKANSDLIEFFINSFCTVEKAFDGYTALSQAIIKQYDAILMDINLSSEMNGIEVTRAIKIMDNYKEIPINAITGYATANEKEQILKNGLTHFISKPFEKEVLISTIRQALRLP